jgi:hypothetical protein
LDNKVEAFCVEVNQKFDRKVETEIKETKYAIKILRKGSRLKSAARLYLNAEHKA